MVGTGKEDALMDGDCDVSRITVRVTGSDCSLVFHTDSPEEAQALGSAFAEKLRGDGLVLDLSRIVGN